VPRLPAAVAAGLLVLAAAPALATEEPVLLEPCSNAAGAVLLTPDGLERSVAGTAVLPQSPSAFDVVVDLSGAVEGTTSSVGVTMTWGIPTNDYDLRVVAGGLNNDSQGLQPLDEAREEVFLSGQQHCARLTVQVRNFAAPVVVDTVELALTSKPRRPATPEA
jgi:hypothetical protein